MALYEAQFIWGDLSHEAARSPGRLKRDFVEKSVEAVCAQDAERLKSVLAEALGSLGGGMPQRSLLNFLGEMMRDKRLTIGWDADLSQSAQTEFENAISAASCREQLCASLASLLLAKKRDNKQPMKDTVKMVEEYLIANYSKPITHNMLSSQFGFVSSYISKVFRKHRGLSPSEFLTKYRVEKAKEIMGSRSDVLIKDIALAVGYSDYFYFSKIFKKETGLWPKEYMSRKAEPKPPAGGPFSEAARGPGGAFAGGAHGRGPAGK
jgi:AraC-like DNA-binding protein